MEHEHVMKDASANVNDYVDMEINDEEIDPDSEGVESTSTKKRKTRTLKSQVWKWFTIIEKSPTDPGPLLCVCVTNVDKNIKQEVLRVPVIYFVIIRNVNKKTLEILVNI